MKLFAYIWWKCWDAIGKVVSVNILRNKVFFIFFDLRIIWTISRWLLCYVSNRFVMKLFLHVKLGMNCMRYHETCPIRSSSLFYINPLSRSDHSTTRKKLLRLPASEKKQKKAKEKPRRSEYFVDILGSMPNKFYCHLTLSGCWCIFIMFSLCKNHDYH